MGRLPTAALAERILPTLLATEATTVVGIDGPDCAGKSTLARSIATLFGDGIAVLHGDDYLAPAALVRDLDRLEVETFICDFFDWDQLEMAFEKCLIDRPQVLVVEGMFLASAPFRARIGTMIRLEIDETEVVRRALERDVGPLGEEGWVRAHYERQCLPAQRIYRRLVRPNDLADWLIDTSGPGYDAKIIRRPGG